MIKTLAQKELTELWREGRVKWFAVIISLLLVTTAVTSFRYSRQLKSDHAAGMKADRETWDNQGPKNPHGAAHYGFYLFKPVSPLSLFEPGVDRYMGSTLYLEAHIRNNEQYAAIGDESDLSRLGFLSPAFILQYLLPLLIIIAGFNIISKERENDNARLLLSQGASGRQLFFGKWLALFILVSLILVPGFLLGLALLLVQRAGTYQYAATGAMFILYLLFYAIIINIILWISQASRQSGHALLYGIVFWMLSSVLAPRLSASLSGQLSPLLRHDEVMDRVRELARNQADAHSSGGTGDKHLIDSLLKHYKVDTVTKLPVNLSGIRLDMGEQRDTRNYEILTAEQERRLARQQNIITTGSLFSPLIPAQQLSMALSNTDVYSHRHFADEGEQYRRKFVGIMNRYLAYESGAPNNGTNYQADEKLWKRVPAFSYQAPGFRILTRYIPSAIILTGWLLITLTLLLISANRFKP